MVTLISTLGDTDPIRDFHDGSLLHISRIYRPDEIILIHSERTKLQEKNINIALNSIDGYHPKIKIFDEVLLNNEVYQFDLMFEKLSDILMRILKSQKGEEILLNLSSGTPQMKSALFTFNRIYDLNINAIQVVSPSNNSNQGITHQNTEDIELLIQLNEDNCTNPINRTKVDTGLNISKTLKKRTIIDLLRNYDYSAALEVLETLGDFEGRKVIVKHLSETRESLYYQKIPSKIQKLKISNSAKLVLNSFLIINIQLKRGNLTDCLVRLKSLLEFIYKDFIEEQYGLDIDDKDYYNLFDLYQIIRDRGDEYFTRKYTPLVQLNSTRNILAHTISEIDKNSITDLGKAINVLKTNIIERYQLTNKMFCYYEELNEHIVKTLKGDIL